MYLETMYLTILSLILSITLVYTLPNDDLFLTNLKNKVFKLTNVEEGDDIALHCPIPEMDIPTKESVIVEWINPIGFRLSETPDLYIASIKKSQAGHYACRWYSTSEKTEYDHAVFDLTEISKKSYETQVEKNGINYEIIMRRHEQESLKPKGYIKRNCLVSTNQQEQPVADLFSYTWNSDSRRRNKRSKNFIMKISKKDLTTTITCTARSFKDPSIVLKQRTKLFLFEGQEAHRFRQTPMLKLSFPSYTPPYRMHCELHQDEKDAYSVNLNYVLKINDEVVKDGGEHNLGVIKSGEYECVAQGQIGNEPWILSTKRNVDLGDVSTIQVRPPFLAIGGPEVKTAEFHCEIDNIKATAKDLVWSFIPNGKTKAEPLPVNVEVKIIGKVVETSYLVLKNPQPSNNGEYVCQVPNTSFVSKGLYTYKIFRPIRRRY